MQTLEEELEFTTKSLSFDLAPECTPGRGNIAPGTVIAGRYKVIQKIGEGGMAFVYLIEQIFLKERMALKVLTSGLSDSSLVRFQKEAQVCRMLDHPNLIRVIDFALLDKDSPYLVMEFIDGESLADILKRRGQLTEAEAIEIFLQIMDGLGYAHEQKVIHRDLKPSNVMLFQRPNRQLQVKILDFGIAKITGKDTLNTMTLTATGEIFGSPLYMSPEQCLGRNVDLRSDFYSVGCALYHVLTGAPPFTGDSALSTMMLHLEGQPLSLKQASLGKDFSQGIEKVTMRLLEKSPDKRYQTAAEVRDDLLAISDSLAQRDSVAKIKPVPSEAKVSPPVSVIIAACIIFAASCFVVFTFMTSKSSHSSFSPDLKATTLSTQDIAKEPTKLSGPPFATMPLKDCKSGQWIFNFPDKEIGKIGIADLKYELSGKLLPSLSAKGRVVLDTARPLIFATYMHDIEPAYFTRFRPDEIEQLKLLDSEVNDEAIAAIEHYQALRYLYLNNCLSLTNKSLQSIQKLRNLSSLRIMTTLLDMAQVGRMVANSRIKKFDGSELEEADVFCHEISRSKNLVELSLDNNADLTDKGLEEISKMTNLKVLSLRTTPKVTNVGVEKLSNLKQLTAVNLQEMHLTSDVITAFRRFPSGCHIVVDTQQWSKSEQQLFKKEFPNSLVP